MVWWCGVVVWGGCKPRSACQQNKPTCKLLGITHMCEVQQPLFLRDVERALDFRALFNALPHIDHLPRCLQNGHRGLGEPGPELKACIKSHGLLFDVAITLTHKHIDLQEGDIIIGSYDPIENRVIMSFRPLDSEADSELIAHLVPFQWVYSQVHKWIPVAYWDSRADHGDVILERFRRMVATPLLEDFSKTMSETLSPAAMFVHGANGQEFAKFGVSLVFQTAVRGHEQGLMETTSDTERNQWFRLTSAVPLGEGANIETTIWHWKHNSDTTMEDQCDTDCVRYYCHHVIVHT